MLISQKWSVLPRKWENIFNLTILICHKITTCSIYKPSKYLYKYGRLAFPRKSHKDKTIWYSFKIVVVIQWKCLAVVATMKITIQFVPKSLLAGHHSSHYIPPPWKTSSNVKHRFNWSIFIATICPLGSLSLTLMRGNLFSILESDGLIGKHRHYGRVLLLFRSGIKNKQIEDKP